MWLGLKMARHESDREDLMKEATALVRRVEFESPTASENIIAGFRSNGWLSIYLGPDPVYHFDAETRLRRAYVDGSLYRTQGNTLARLTRHRLPDVTELQRHDLDATELSHFLDHMQSQLQSFHDALTTGRTTVVAQIPSEDTIVDDLMEKLEKLHVANELLAPKIAGKT